MTTVAHQAAKGHRTVRLPLSETDYERFMTDNAFAKEARTLDRDYQPETVNTDGWQATQAAWCHLFPTVTVILCFLHAYLKVRDRATKALAKWFSQAGDKIWEAYRATTKRAFSQRLRRLQEWADQHLPDSPMKTHTVDLCNKRKQFIQSYDYPNAHRTSNLVDRLMRFMDRAFSMPSISMAPG